LEGDTDGVLEGVPDFDAVPERDFDGVIDGVTDGVLDFVGEPD